MAINHPVLASTAHATGTGRAFEIAGRRLNDRFEPKSFARARNSQSQGQTGSVKGRSEVRTAHPVAEGKGETSGFELIWAGGRSGLVTAVSFDSMLQHSREER